MIDELDSTKKASPQQQKPTNTNTQNSSFLGENKMTNVIDFQPEYIDIKTSNDFSIKTEVITKNKYPFLIYEKLTLTYKENNVLEIDVNEELNTEITNVQIIESSVSNINIDMNSKNLEHNNVTSVKIKLRHISNINDFYSLLFDIVCTKIENGEKIIETTLIYMHFLFFPNQNKITCFQI